MTKELLNWRDWIAGLEKGLAILEAFDYEHSWLTPIQVAELTGLTRTTARRYPLTLEHLGYLTSKGTLLSLTPHVLKVGWSYFDSVRLPRTAQPFLRQVTAAVGEVVYLSMSGGWELVLISRTSTSWIMGTGFILDIHVPAPLTLTGVMVLVAQPEQKVKAWLETRVLTPYTSYTTLQRDCLFDEICKADRQDYAVVEQQLQIGVRGVAVPLRDRYGNVTAALSVNMQVGEETTRHALQRVLQVPQDIVPSIMRVL